MQASKITHCCIKGRNVRWPNALDLQLKTADPVLDETIHICLKHLLKFLCQQGINCWVHKEMSAAQIIAFHQAILRCNAGISIDCEAVGALSNAGSSEGCVDRQDSAMCPGNCRLLLITEYIMATILAGAPADIVKDKLMKFIERRGQDIADVAWSMVTSLWPEVLGLCSRVILNINILLSAYSPRGGSGAYINDELQHMQETLNEFQRTYSPLNTLSLFAVIWSPRPTELSRIFIAKHLRLEAEALNPVFLRYNELAELLDVLGIKELVKVYFGPNSLDIHAVTEEELWYTVHYNMPDTRREYLPSKTWNDRCYGSWNCDLNPFWGYHGDMEKEEEDLEYFVGRDDDEEEMLFFLDVRAVEEAEEEAEEFDDDK
ncbi:hypothetical protein DFH09DRAFT_1078738 [Mycena vulgaris]|nr:hypothetical protein DFH09DRAFT_1078738 [Mycena vulgaris]